MKKLSELRDEAARIAKKRFKSEIGLKNALETLRSLDEGVAHLRRVIKDTAKSADELREVCGEFVAENPDKLSEVVKENGVLRSGTIAIEDAIAGYSLRIGEFVRKSGEQKTQAFLETLPKNWVKRDLKLSTANINKLLENGKITEADLEQNDLERKYAHSWSWKFGSDAEVAIDNESFATAEETQKK